MCVIEDKLDALRGDIDGIKKDMDYLKRDVEVRDKYLVESLTKTMMQTLDSQHQSGLIAQHKIEIRLTALESNVSTSRTSNTWMCFAKEIIVILSLLSTIILAIIKWN
jgi:hypothetical protein